MAIVGDRTYGDFALNRCVARELGVRELQLLSAEIAFPCGTFIGGRQFVARSPHLESFLDWSKFLVKIT
jgi:hypothetical protein